MRARQRFARGATAVALALAVGASLGACRGEEAKAEADFSGYRQVCELSTLEVYFHNVARANEESNGMLFGLGDIGYKKMWFEYSGVVEFGIDASKVTVSEPDANGVVTVTLPEAGVQDVNIIEDSITDPVVDAGWLTGFTAEEEAAALADAQRVMRETAEQDSGLKLQARERARDLLEEYVKNCGEVVGETYTVRWEDV